jgi:hypothetical protein
VRGKLEYNTQGACTNGRESSCFTKRVCSNSQVRGKFEFYTELAPRERKLE